MKNCLLANAHTHGVKPGERVHSANNRHKGKVGQDHDQTALEELTRHKQKT